MTELTLPRYGSFPDWTSTAGSEAIDLAASTGLYLDEWQKYVLENSLGETRGEGKWAAFEVALIVPRQQGKTVLIEARELAGLFLFGERLIMHSAHMVNTAKESFNSIAHRIEDTPHLARKLKHISRVNGNEQIELVGGQRLKFFARSKNSGRGFSSDTAIFDEAFSLSEDAVAAMMPTLSARPNPQVWYVSSAGLDDSHLLAQIRDRGRASEPGLAYFEWSADSDASLDDQAAWAAANPAFGIRIKPESIQRERVSMGEREFARERLGIWNDPRSHTVIDPDLWALLADPGSRPVDPVTFAVDVTPDRSSASVAVGARRADGLLHVEVVRNNRGTGWVAAYVAERVKKWGADPPLIDPAVAGSLIDQLKERDTEVRLVAGREMGQACGAFFDAVADKQLRHLDQPMLNTALGAARKRPYGEAWAWARKDTSVDISPLVAATLALFGASTAPKPKRKATAYGF